MRGFVAGSFAMVFVASLLWPAAEDSEWRVYTVFAEEIPAVQRGQIVIQSHEYLACVDPDRRQPVWVAYSVERSDHDPSRS